MTVEKIIEDSNLTLTALAEHFLGPLFRDVLTAEEVEMRAHAAQIAITRLSDRRRKEIQTMDQMKEKAARRVAAREAAEKI